MPYNVNNNNKQTFQDAPLTKIVTKVPDARQLTGLTIASVDCLGSQRSWLPSSCSAWLSTLQLLLPPDLCDPVTSNRCMLYRFTMHLT